MNKTLILLGLIIFFSNCSKNNNERPDVKGLAEKTEYKIFPSGNPKIPASKTETICEFKGIITSFSVDSISAKITNVDAPWSILIAVPKQKEFSKSIGEAVTIEGTQWSGAYESGWSWKIK